jgi:hypothetical protein
MKFLLELVMLMMFSGGSSAPVFSLTDIHGQDLEVDLGDGIVR